MCGGCSISYQHQINMSTLIETCRISPPPGTVADRSLPLTFFDIQWLHFHPIRRLLFYELPCSKPCFLDTHLPKLKQSLSLTLEHYFPLAGNLVYPLDTTNKMPIFRYVDGDSVPLTIFESTNDFDILVGNHARDADTFYDYIPQLSPIITDESSSHKLLHVFALQVTFFPGRGICIGIANHHVVGDASSIVGFIRAWASMCKLGGDDDESLPVFNRDLLKDPLGLNSMYWNDSRDIPLKVSSFPLPTRRVRATYVLNQSEIKKLKDSVLERFPGFVHPSSFVMVAAYVWSCLAKSLKTGEEEGDDGEMEYFLFPADGRARLDPPLPGNYFGNCLTFGLVKTRQLELVGTNGFFVAAEAIADEIKNKVNDKEKILKGAENGKEEYGSLLQKRVLSVSGSARVDLYGADFGWGKARKMETLSIDDDIYSMSICKSRDGDGGLEIGLSLLRVKMDAFAALFADGMKSF